MELGSISDHSHSDHSDQDPAEGRERMAGPSKLRKRLEKNHCFFANQLQTEYIAFETRVITFKDKAMWPIQHFITDFTKNPRSGIKRFRVLYPSGQDMAEIMANFMAFVQLLHQSSMDVASARVATLLNALHVERLHFFEVAFKYVVGEMALDPLAWILTLALRFGQSVYSSITKDQQASTVCYRLNYENSTAHQASAPDATKVFDSLRERIKQITSGIQIQTLSHTFHATYSSFDFMSIQSPNVTTAILEAGKLQPMMTLDVQIESYLAVVKVQVLYRAEQRLSTLQSAAGAALQALTATQSLQLSQYDVKVELEDILEDIRKTMIAAQDEQLRKLNIAPALFDVYYARMAEICKRALDDARTSLCAWMPKFQQEYIKQSAKQATSTNMVKRPGCSAAAVRFISTTLMCDYNHIDFINLDLLDVSQLSSLLRQAAVWTTNMLESIGHIPQSNDFRQLVLQGLPKSGKSYTLKAMAGVFGCVAYLPSNRSSFGMEDQMAACGLYIEEFTRHDVFFSSQPESKQFFDAASFQRYELKSIHPCKIPPVPIIGATNANLIPTSEEEYNDLFKAFGNSQTFNYAVDPVVRRIAIVPQSMYPLDRLSHVVEGSDYMLTLRLQNTIMMMVLLMMKKSTWPQIKSMVNKKPLTDYCRQFFDCFEAWHKANKQLVWSRLIEIHDASEPCTSVTSNPLYSICLLHEKQFYNSYVGHFSLALTKKKANYDAFVDWYQELQDSAYAILGRVLLGYESFPQPSALKDQNIAFFVHQAFSMMQPYLRRLSVGLHDAFHLDMGNRLSYESVPCSESCPPLEVQNVTLPPLEYAGIQCADGVAALQRLVPVSSQHQGHSPFCRFVPAQQTCEYLFPFKSFIMRLVDCEFLFYAAFKLQPVDVDHKKPKRNPREIIFGYAGAFNSHLTETIRLLKQDRVWASFIENPYGFLFGSSRTVNDVIAADNLMHSYETLVRTKFDGKSEPTLIELVHLEIVRRLCKQAKYEMFSRIKLQIQTTRRHCNDESFCNSNSPLVIAGKPMYTPIFTMLSATNAQVFSFSQLRPYALKRPDRVLGGCNLSCMLYQILLEIKWCPNTVAFFLDEKPVLQQPHVDMFEERSSIVTNVFMRDQRSFLNLCQPTSIISGFNAEQVSVPAEDDTFGDAEFIDTTGLGQKRERLYPKELAMPSKRKKE